MVSWIILVALVVLFYLFLKMRYVQHRLFIIFLMILVIFIYTTGAKLISENNIDITTNDGFLTATKLYFAWLGHVFDNTKTIVGNVIKMDWQGNSTVS